MSGFVVRKLGVGGAIASAVFVGVPVIGTIAMIAAAPLSAQLYSEGYEFLKAVKDRDGDAVTQLLNQPGTQVVNTRDISSGDTGLHVVAERRDVLWIRFLLQRGANPNIRNKKGMTPLQLATTLGFVDGVEELIKGGADVEVSDAQGETPLITAVHQRNIPLIARLLKQGANPDRNDNSGRSARDYAGLLGANDQIMDEFKAADADRGKQGTTKDYGPSL